MGAVCFRPTGFECPCFLLSPLIFFLFGHRIVWADLFRISPITAKFNIFLQRVQKMSMCHVGRVFKLTALAMSLLMAGCASSLTRVDTWEGDLPAATEPAVLKAPGDIQVARVNGKAMTNYLMDDLALDYGLPPGSNEVVFTYKTIWAKTGVVNN